MSNTRGRSLKRTVAGVSAGVLTLTGAAAALAVPASAQSTFSFTRLAGADRYATAAAVATSSFTTSDTVLVASGRDFPDALAGNFLAGFKGAPILLVAPGSVPTATSDALTKLAAKNVIILGGTSAVSASVQATLSAKYTVTRVAGSNRYATARAIAATAGVTVGTIGGVKTAVLASGATFADALTAGPLGYAKQFPITITDPAALSADTKATFSNLGIKNVIIAGGTAAVSAAVEAEVKALGITTTRLAGNTRQLTAVAIANFETANGFGSTHVNLARGDDFADALAGGPHAGKELAPILLTDTPAVLGAAATVYLSAHANALTSGNIFGGTAAVSDAVKTAGETAAKGVVAASLTTQPELRSATVVSTVATAQANTANPAGTTVKYVFDEQVLTATAANFKLYLNSDTATTTPTIISVSGNTVTVLYTTILNTTGPGATNINNYTLAAVAPNAVLDGQNETNPEGSASIGTAATSTTVAAADTTAAPDLRTIGNFRQANPAVGQFPNSTAVDFTFDKAATVTTATGFHLVLPDGTVLNGTGPTGATVANGGTAGGGTVPGGQGTTVITVVFVNNVSGVTLAATDVARGYADLNTVQDSTATFGNESIVARVTNNGITTGPDLLSVAVAEAGSTNNSTGFDQVLYTFDSAATTPVAANFVVFKSTAGAPVAASTAVAVTGQPNQVLASFPTSTLQDGAGAVALTGAIVGGKTDERGFVAPSASTSNRTPGQVTAPQLMTVALASTTDITNTTVFTATYTFDKSIGAVVLTAAQPALFHLYDSNGNRLDGATCAVPAGATATNTVVVCSAFADTNSPASTDTLQKKVGAATLGTVSVGAVTGNTAPNNFANPEGAAATTGGTGTPAA